MKMLKTGVFLIIVFTGGISPVLADCCGSLLDCAATVVTDGLSCEVETIISTIKDLMTTVQNLADDVTGRTQNAQQSARQYVSDTINSLQSQSQQDASALAAAASQAQAIYAQETVLRPAHLETEQKPENLQNSGAPQSASTAPSHTPLIGSTMQRSSSAAPTPQNNSNPGNSMQRNTVMGNAQNVVTYESQRPPPGSYGEDFALALKQITALKGAGDADTQRINQDLANAQASEGPGVTSANTLAGALSAPITNIESELSSLLSNPLDAFDPTDSVTALENSVKSHLDVNIAQMIADITTGPNQAFADTTPVEDKLYVEAQQAQAIAAAMQALYKDRSAKAVAALHELLPKQQYAAVSTKSISATLTGNQAQRLSSNTLTPRFTAFKQATIAAVKAPSFDKIHLALARFKAQRVQGAAARSASMLQSYHDTSDKKFVAYFSGSSPASIATQRDALIAQARIQFAKDPTTENKVVGLINSEAAKRGGFGNSTAPHAQAAASSQAAVASRSTVTTAPSAGSMSSFRPQTGLIAPASAVTPSMPASQVKTSTWGTTPAWTPPAATTPAVAPNAASGATAISAATPSAPHVVTAVRLPTALKPVAPVELQQQLPTPVAVHAAPSSITGP